MNIPQQYLPIMPYLIVRDAKAFIVFIKKVFGAEEQLVVPRDEKTIAHAELRIGGAVIMLADATEQFNEKTAGMFIYVEKVDTVYDSALQNNSTSLMPPGTQEYGYTAGFEDPFGNQWWITQP